MMQLAIVRPGAPLGNRGAAVTLPSSGYALVGRITRPNNSGDPYVRIAGTVGSAGALTSLKLATRMLPDSAEFDKLADAAIETPSVDLVMSVNKSSPGTPIHQCPASGRFEILLAMYGLSEVSLYARGASDTTLTVEGAV